MAYRAFVAVLGAALLISHDSLRKIAVIEVPGPKGQRFDYLAIDAEDRYLLSAHLGPGILYVVDMHTNKLVKAIPGLPGITGLEYVPGLHKVYTSNWGEEKIGVVDLRTMSVRRGCRQPSPRSELWPRLGRLRRGRLGGT